MRAGVYVPVCMWLGLLVSVELTVVRTYLDIHLDRDRPPRGRSLRHCVPHRRHEEVQHDCWHRELPDDVAKLLVKAGCAVEAKTPAENLAGLGEDVRTTPETATTRPPENAARPKPAPARPKPPKANKTQAEATPTPPTPATAPPTTP